MNTLGVRGTRYAECREGLGEFLEAAAEYEKEDMLVEAIRCLRMVPDTAGAITLATRVASRDLPVLKAMQSLETMFTEQIVSSLTDAERNYALKLSARKDSITSTDIRPF